MSPGRDMHIGRLSDLLPADRTPEGGRSLGSPSRPVRERSDVVMWRYPAALIPSSIYQHDLHDVLYSTAASEKPDRPKRTQPVLPESLTATTSARSPFRKAPMGLPCGFCAMGACRFHPSLSSRVCARVSERGRGAGLRSYCGPTFWTGPFGSSGSWAKTSVS